MTKGKFIVIEGLDLVGKSTLISKLKELEPNYVYTREPGGTDCKFAEEIRELILRADNIDPLTEAYLFAASRNEHSRKINEWVNEGKVVICDRFLYSSLYYQGCMKGLDRGPVRVINSFIDYPKPDMVYYLTICENERKIRMSKRKELNSLDIQSFKQDYKKANGDFIGGIRWMKVPYKILDVSNRNTKVLAKEILKEINKI